MARTTITKTQAVGGYIYSGVSLNLQAGDAANGNQFAMVGGEFIILQNSGGTPRVVTLSSVADAYGRTKDISETLAAGAFAVYGPFLPAGWKQTDGNFYLNVAHADVKIAVLSPPV